MSPLARALIGVALGSCVTLFIHPQSRPYMMGLIPKPSEAARIAAVNGMGSGPMEVPGSTAEAGLWMQLGCARLAAGQKLSREEIESLLKIASIMEKSTEFDNAFWPQMEAVFREQLGDKTGAEKAWFNATKCQLWKDYQSARLLNEADNTANPLAWHFAGLYYQRRFVVGEAIIDYARRAIDEVGQTSTHDIEFRYATLINAHLMTIGARSVQMLTFGATLSDLSVQPAHSPPLTDPALREKARGRLTDALDRMQQHPQATSAKRALAQIDGKMAETRPFKPTETAAKISAQSIVTATLPDALLFIALIGAIAYPIGLLLLRFSLDHSSFAWPPTLAFGGVLGISVIWLALPPLAAIVAVLCALFLNFTPKQERSRLPSELGGMFTFAVGILSLFFTVAVIACLAALSTPAKLLLPIIFQQNSGLVSTQIAVVLIGLAAMTFALLLLVAPMWAFVRRVRTPFVLGLVLRTFGTTLIAIGLAGTVILAPICIYLDSTARTTLAELVGNEPVHYYGQFE